jgi:hypothetical protein
MSITMTSLVLAAGSLPVAAMVALALPRAHATSREVGIGVVRATTRSDDPTMVTVDVESVCGGRFTGRLRTQLDDTVLAGLKPGVVLLVAFDPAAREWLSLADDMLAIRADFDRMLVGKGLLSVGDVELIRHGVRSHGVVTATRSTGTTREHHRQVELDLMVSRPGGGQFPARATTFVPDSVLDRVTPGSVVDTYHRAGDESAIAVCVPPS